MDSVSNGVSFHVISEHQNETDPVWKQIWLVHSTVREQEL